MNLDIQGICQYGYNMNSISDRKSRCLNVLWIAAFVAFDALKEKIESVDILERRGKTMKIIAIGDNDNGSTRIFRLILPVDKHER
jgi:hypothetical protein